MIDVILYAAFGTVLVAVAAMLITTGVGRELFGRFALRGGVKPELSDASSEWIDNHDFWELGEVEEVAF